MQEMSRSVVPLETEQIQSTSLNREVRIDHYGVGSLDATTSLLLINDGQNLSEMDFGGIIQALYNEERIGPLLVLGIHAGEQRKREYGVAVQKDYLGRGDLAAAYSSFIINELVPSISERYPLPFRTRAFAGFSLGALSALDIAWSHPGLFQVVGVFSGSLWWRSLDQADPLYRDDQHRIMHQQIRRGQMIPGMKFYLQCGNMDETKDRNNNGIIDSIDDTIDLMRELEAKGYRLGKDIHFCEMVNGRHDVATWGRAMPEFLEWGFRK